MSKIKVDEKLVKHIAQLARIKVDDAEISNLTTYMEKVLSYMELLQGVDTTHTAPFFSPVQHQQKIFQQYLQQDFNTHPDIIHASLSAFEVIKNAPLHEEGQFKIQAVIEEQ